MNTIKRYFLKLLLITLSMFILAAPFVGLQIYYPHQAVSLHQAIANHSLWFTALRLLLIAGFFMLWPRVIQHIAKNHEWSVYKTYFWLSQRVRVTGWLLVIDLLVCESIFPPFI